MSTITASRHAPSAYILDTNRVEQGQTFIAHGDTYEIVGEPITAGWRMAFARVREIGGRHDGNEFGGYLSYGR